MRVGKQPAANSRLPIPISQLNPWNCVRTFTTRQFNLAFRFSSFFSTLSTSSTHLTTHQLLPLWFVSDSVPQIQLLIISISYPLLSTPTTPYSIVRVSAILLKVDLLFYYMMIRFGVVAWCMLFLFRSMWFDFFIRLFHVMNRVYIYSVDADGILVLCEFRVWLLNSYFQFHVLLMWCGFELSYFFMKHELELPCVLIVFDHKYAMSLSVIDPVQYRMCIFVIFVEAKISDFCWFL